jgi:hypothetical protein
MKNLNAICLHGTTLYVFTKDSYLLSIEIGDLIAALPTPKPQF